MDAHYWLLPEETVNKMDFVSLSWLFALAVTLHNVEEALFLPAWSRKVGVMVNTKNKASIEKCGIIET
jgi:hypothetical protein